MDLQQLERLKNLCLDIMISIYRLLGLNIHLLVGILVHLLLYILVILISVGKKLVMLWLLGREKMIILK